MVGKFLFIKNIPTDKLTTEQSWWSNNDRYNRIKPNLQALIFLLWRLWQEWSKWVLMRTPKLQQFWKKIFSVLSSEVEILKSSELLITFEWFLWSWRLTCSSCVSLSWCQRSGTSLGPGDPTPGRSARSLTGTPFLCRTAPHLRNTGHFWLKQKNFH